MSSPSARQRRRREQYQAPRSRRDLLIAIGAGVFIVGATALVIWTLRPGGIADRQPRSSWLFAISLLAIVIACYVILRPGSRVKADHRIALAVSIGAILVVTALVGVLWPNGLLRHTPTVATVPTTPTSPTPTSPTTPSTPGSTGVTPSSAPGTTGPPPSSTSAAPTTTSTIP